MHAYKDTKDIAATIRERLKKELPGWKFHVRIERFAGGSSIEVALMEGMADVMEGVRDNMPLSPDYGKVKEMGFQYAQLNHLAFGWADAEEKRLTNGYVLTPIGWDVMKKASEIMLAERWDDSDAQLDYFCCNFYAHLNIGKWNKPYQVKGRGKQ